MADFINSCDGAKEGNITLAKLCYQILLGIFGKNKILRIFRTKQHPWEMTSNRTLRQSRAREIYLNIETSDQLAAA